MVRLNGVVIVNKRDGDTVIAWHTLSNIVLIVAKFTSRNNMASDSTLAR